MLRATIFSTLCLAVLAGCGTLSSINPFKGKNGSQTATLQASRSAGSETVSVNKYLWAASLDVLSFLPIQTVDPFTGVIVTGYGTPPNGKRAYRANIHVRSSALAARALSVSLMTRNGPASAETIRMVEDAILTRARQLRIQD